MLRFDGLAIPGLQVTVTEPLAESPSGSGTIVLVVGEGLEVLLPMAGVTSSVTKVV